MKMKSFIRIILTAIILLSAPAFTYGQCKDLVKKYTSKLSPYIHNGQQNTAFLSPGETVEFELTFYSGQNYKIMVGGEEVGDVYFKVMDTDRNMLYNSQDSKNPGMWEFTVYASQQMIVQIVAPKGKATSKGCAAMVVGFKTTSYAGTARNL